MSKKTKAEKHGKPSHKAKGDECRSIPSDVDRPQVDYEAKPYAFFQSLNWPELWKEFISVDDGGKFKYATANQFAHKQTKSATEKNWLYTAIGPKVREEHSKELKERKRLPYIGDWMNLRSSLFVGETNKQSLLFNNPKVSVLREILKTHLDVFESTKGIADLYMDWMARWATYSHQIDEYFGYKIADASMKLSEVTERFDAYTKMQEKLFDLTKETARQILRCMGVGEQDVSLLAQVMIASLKSGDMSGRAGILMQLQAAGEDVRSGKPAIIDAGGDQAQIDESKKCFDTNPTLATFVSSFLAKSHLYKMPHPDMHIEGVPDEEDDSTDPKLDKEKVRKPH